MSASRSLLSAASRHLLAAASSGAQQSACTASRLLAAASSGAQRVSALLASGAAPQGPAACASASDAVLRSVARVPFRSGVRAGLFTVEAGAAHSPPLVLLHGFAMGSAMWCLSLDALAARFRVFAVDLRGCGASPRPAWPAAASGSHRLDVDAGERWFVESIETWRAAVGLESFHLLGHSLGGYIAAAYALAAPHRVRHLLLASPAGVAPPPPAAEQRALRSANWAFAAAAYAWDRGLTPQAIIGAAGPRLAARRVGELFDRRFGAIIQAHPRGAPLNRAALREYLYAINARGGSGDGALPALLDFGAFARAPLAPRLLRAAVAARMPPP